MDRRTLIVGSTVIPIGAPLVAVAQKSAMLRKIGILTLDSPESQATLDRYFAPLRALGWIEGQNLRVERRFASGKIELLGPLAQELVRLEVELIGTLSTPATLAAKNATKTIPIVIWSAGDPVGTGLVASLARPGGNVTGFSLLDPELEMKRVELLRELVPALQRVGVLETANPRYSARRADLERACRSIGVQPIFFEVSSPTGVDNAVTELVRQGARALVVPSEPLFYENPGLVMTAAAKYALPTVVANDSIIATGALLSLVHSEDEQDERFAWFVDKILRGAKPAELPIQQPTRFALVVNLKAAKALGLAVPQSILQRANEVIK